MSTPRTTPHDISIDMVVVHIGFLTMKVVVDMECSVSEWERRS